MRALVVSDLHSNSEALRSALARVRRKKYDTTICLGDFVGYGAQPNQVLDVMRRLKGPKHYIRGNHDRVAAGFEDGEGFNHAARYAALWTREKLSGPNRTFLHDLPIGPVTHGDVVLCHGSPADEDEYIFTEYHAARVLARFDAPWIVYGHTHLPVVFSVDPEGRVSGMAVRGEALLKLDRRNRYLINPGSVGQPRDRNPQSAFAIIDTDKYTVQFFRVEYDIAATQESIIRAGLPRILADRLSVGT
jgi:predicted phosphodiesterase